MNHLRKIATTLGLFALVLFWVTAAEPPGKAPVRPLSPREELATFRILDGFKSNSPPASRTSSTPSP
jgi:hypothetical protein